MAPFKQLLGNQSFRLEEKRRFTKLWPIIPVKSGVTSRPVRTDGADQADQELIVLCYSLGETVTWTTPPLPHAPQGVTNTSDAWDFVVTSDQDAGGYVADVFIDTHGDIRHQLGEQGRCDHLKQRLV